MRSILIIFTVLAMLCPNTPASGKKADESAAIQMLRPNKKAKTLEGTTMRLARPVLKKTPMSVFIDNIDALLICPLEKSDKAYLDKVETMLGGYAKVNEILYAQTLRTELEYRICSEFCKLLLAPAFAVSLGTDKRFE